MTAPRRQNGVEVALILRLQENKAEAKLRGCESKRRYADEYSCRAAGIESLHKGDQLYFYKCQHCRGYHLTKVERPAYFAVDYLEKKGYK